MRVSVGDARDLITDNPEHIFGSIREFIAELA